MGKSLVDTSGAKEKACKYYESYLELGSVHKVGGFFGVSHSVVHRHLKVFGYKLKGEKFSEKEDAIIFNYYKNTPDSLFSMNELISLLGFRSSSQNICRRARQLGLTNIKRKMSDVFKINASERSKEWHKTNEHPKGYLGKKHSSETKVKLSKVSINMWQNMTEEKLAERTLKHVKTRHKNGTLYPNRAKCTWKQQWATVGGVRKYFRSQWELNYAHYLEWLKSKGQIKSWEHEPETFWFEGVKRGCVSYLPDFRVVENNDSIAYHEVKGWMDDRSKTKIKRMAKYHPTVKLIVIDSKAYASLSRDVSGLVDGWV